MRQRLWALLNSAGQVYSRGGAVLVHPNSEELEFLFPGRAAVEVTGTELPCTWWRNHPQMDGIRFPLVREDFR